MVLPKRHLVLIAIAFTISLGLADLGNFALMAQANSPAMTPTIPPNSTPETWPLLRQGDSGEAVRQLQVELHRIGTFDAPQDGFYGTNTETAVRQFQQQQGLSPDGIVGPRTWQALALAQTHGTLLTSEMISGENLPAFTPLTFSQPAPPPSPLWLVLMPLVPLIGGTLTYLQRRIRGRPSSKEPKSHRSARKRKRNQRSS